MARESHMSDEVQIRDMIAKRARAVGEKDVDTLVSMYAPDALLYEVLPPLTHSGSAVKESTENWLFSYGTEIGYDVQDLDVTVGEDVAFGNYLYRVTGTLNSGEEVEMWVRATVCLQKKEGMWRVVHEHQSVPFDPETGQALTNLAP